jgi:glycosyltransferase involved in cell wall biosynthesis
MRAHQLTYGAMFGDAISNHMLEIDARLHGWGYQADLFAQYVAPEMAGRVHQDGEYIAYLDAVDDLLVYHYSIYTPNVRFFQATRGRRILIYHNITPGHFFHGWDADLEAQCDVGRCILSTLVDCDLALGDSEFNRQELIEAGFPAGKTGVLPIFLPRLQSESRLVNETLRTKLHTSGVTNWLTVGRVVPSKAIEDVLRIFYIYNRHINPQSYLYIVGSRYIPAYDAQLDALVAELGLSGQVTFAGRVSDAELVAYYQTADLYITASHHEGFCVPAVECMHFGVPILARKATATPETLGLAGILFSDLGYEQVAEMAHLLVTDDTLRSQVIRKQKERLLELGPDRAEAALRHALGQLGLPPGLAMPSTRGNS